MTDESGVQAGRGDEPRPGSTEQGAADGVVEPVVIRDKRRIDPNGETPLRAVPDPDAPSAEYTELQRHLDEVAKLVEEQGHYSEENVNLAQLKAEAAEALAALATAEAQLAERTVDLQRLQAEFANYRKRVERDRVVVGEQATGRVLAALLPVVDDIERARQHGDIDGAFKAVADQFDGVLAKFGLEAFGDAGDEFDPQLHEAVMHTETEDVDAPTCTTVMRKGYRQGERLLRPAMVGVSDPILPPPPVAEEADEDVSRASGGQA